MRVTSTVDSILDESNKRTSTRMVVLSITSHELYAKCTLDFFSDRFFMTDRWSVFIVSYNLFCPFGPPLDYNIILKKSMKMNHFYLGYYHMIAKRHY
jgi:hypothetical protein